MGIHLDMAERIKERDDNAIRDFEEHCGYCGAMVKKLMIEAAAHEREALAQSDQLENCKKLLIERTSSLTKANYRLEQFNKQKPFGYYENDHGFYCPGFFTNQDKLVAEGTLIPLYCRPAPIPEGWQLAIDYYEQALKASWPEGANGEAFTHWNEARKAMLSAAPKPEDL